MSGTLDPTRTTAFADRRGAGLNAVDSPDEVRRRVGSWLSLMLTIAADHDRSEGNRLGAIERELVAMARALGPP